MYFRSLLLLLAACVSGRADVWMPSIFGDNMVLQQGRKIPVWGKAQPGEEVSVSLSGRTTKVTTGEDGKWKAQLDALQPGSDPFEMRVKGANELVFGNVLIGDVWVCSGQSNMDWPVSKSLGGTDAAAKADFPEIRFFHATKRLAFEPMDDIPGKWVVCKPDSDDLKAFSGVGFFFGREIHTTRKVPVGLIEVAWGGTPAQAWTSLEKLAAHPTLKQYARSFLSAKENLPALKAKYQKESLPRWKEAMEKWKASPVPRGRQPRRPVPEDKSGKLPVVLFNGLINPLIPYGIKGVIWYQGEANSARPTEYSELFPLMITDWRERWGQGDFPFIFVQLAGFRNPNWPAQREAQKRALALPATAMAVALDVGEERNIHPKDKLTVGLRLAQAAKHVAYGEDVVFSGPTFKESKAKDGALTVTFDHVGGGLTAGRPPLPGSELNGFEVAGADGQFFPAKARIDNTFVIVASDKVANPTLVRYAWMPWPEPMANLYNKEGLPAVPFSLQPDPLSIAVDKPVQAAVEDDSSPE